MKKTLYSLIALISLVSCSQESMLGLPKNMDQWITYNANNIDTEIYSTSDIRLKEGDRAIYNGADQEFTNFNFCGSFKLSKGAKGAIMFHTDSTATNGYEIFLGSGEIDNQIKSGSLTAVRNLFKSITRDDRWTELALSVSGRRITIDIDSIRVVDYTEPDTLFRTDQFAKRVLSSGNFALRCDYGEIEFSSLQVTDTYHMTADSSRKGSENREIAALQQRLFPLIDYHVHLKGLSKEEAYKRSLESGINYGIAPNCGKGFPITNDQQVRDYRDSTMHLPFLFGMQGEGREWPETFSNETRSLFDYVFTDALTFHDHKGRRTQLWIDSLVHIDIPVDAYVDLLIDRAVKVIDTEPLDIFVNPTLLPVKIRDQHDKLWTVQRMDRLITKLREREVALEINDRYQIPNIEFIKRAKEAGIKFTFGTNNTSAENLKNLEYSIWAAMEANLTIDDMWNPTMKKAK